MPYWNGARCLGWVASLALLVGCGGDGDARQAATISGQVLLDGAPLSVGSIQLTSPKTGESASANLDSDGRYSVTFPKADVGADYEVTLGPPVEDDLDATALMENPPEKVRSLIPKKYTDRTTSGLKTTLEAAGENQFNVELLSR
ncbi:carboxypeptidase-like regulatory domain-containing protein [Novipirellula galeiformis]|nr:carboxypeptidase-like regulatory domain-containing protein [Novipirellula galeiformis]